MIVRRVVGFAVLPPSLASYACVLTLRKDLVVDGASYGSALSRICCSNFSMIALLIVLSLLFLFADGSGSLSCSSNSEYSSVAAER